VRAQLRVKFSIKPVNGEAVPCLMANLQVLGPSTKKSSPAVIGSDVINMDLTVRILLHVN